MRVIDVHRAARRTAEVGIILICVFGKVHEAAEDGHIEIMPWQLRLDGQRRCRYEAPIGDRIIGKSVDIGVVRDRFGDRGIYEEIPHPKAFRRRKPAIRFGDRLRAILARLHPIPPHFLAGDRIGDEVSIVVDVDGESSAERCSAESCSRRCAREGLRVAARPSVVSTGGAWLHGCSRLAGVRLEESLGNAHIVPG